MHYRTLSILAAVCALVLAMLSAPASAQYQPDPDQPDDADQPMPESDQPEEPMDQPTEPVPVTPVEPEPAQPAEPTEPYEPGTQPEPVTPVPVTVVPDKTAPKLITPFGMSASIGGGIYGFTDSSTRDFTNDVGGTWEARFGFGTRERISLEAAYVGGALGMDALGLDNSAVLITTSIEGTARVNAFTDTPLQPYALAGVGWRRYDLTNSDFNTSSVNDKDNTFVIPLGAGVAYRYRGFIVDARGLWRASFGNDLIGFTRQEKDDNSLDNWEASLRLGWEF